MTNRYWAKGVSDVKLGGGLPLFGSNPETSDGTAPDMNRATITKTVSFTSSYMLCLTEVAKSSSPKLFEVSRVIYVFSSSALLVIKNNVSAIDSCKTTHDLNGVN